MALEYGWSGGSVVSGDSDNASDSGVMVVVAVKAVARDVDDVWWSRDIKTSTSTRAGPMSNVLYAISYKARCTSSKNRGNIATRYIA